MAREEYCEGCGGLAADCRNCRYCGGPHCGACIGAHEDECDLGPDYDEEETDG